VRLAICAALLLSACQCREDASPEDRHDDARVRRPIDAAWPTVSFCGQTIACGELLARDSIPSIDCHDPHTSDLGPLRPLAACPTPLLMINLRDSGVTDLSALRDLHAIELVNLDGTAVRDLGPLSKQPLKDLSAERDTALTDIALLAAIPTLESLGLSETGIRDLKPLATLRSLKWLDIDHTAVQDLSPLAGSPSLTSLVASRTRVTDLAPLAKLAKLQLLILDGTEVVDLSPLASDVALENLRIRYMPVTDLRPIVDLPQLKHLSIDGTAIADFSPLHAHSWIDVEYYDTPPSAPPCDVLERQIRVHCARWHKTPREFAKFYDGYRE
jgi:Leucine-rich repeat (LRR) protein